MDKAQRINLFKKCLKNVAEGSMGGLIHFYTKEALQGPPNGCFVQFAGGIEGLACDIPIIWLSKEGIEKIRKLPEFFEAKEIGSFQAYFGVSDEDIEKMVNLTEKIFTEIYNLPLNYEIIAEYTINQKTGIRIYPDGKEEKINWIKESLLRKLKLI